jgi:hypothetical protein
MVQQSLTRSTVSDCALFSFRSRRVQNGLSPALFSVYCLDCEAIGDHGASEDGDDAFTDDVSFIGAIEFLNARLVENANISSDDSVGINHALTNDGIRADIGDFVPSGPF